MGDSLGRNRKRRRGASASGAPVPEGPELTEAIGTGAGTTAGAPPSAASSAPGEKKPPRTLLGDRLRGSRFWATVAGLAVFGWIFGYGVATQFLFPAPPPPGDLFEVPDLRGLGMASAEERLAGAGLELGAVDSLQHPTVAAGIVLGQSPLPTQVAPPETPVRLTLSAGPQVRSVPDVRRLAEDRARVVLEASGFVVSVDTAQGEEPRGHVISMSPAPDNVVPLPSQVRIVVSTGPPVVTMPDLLLLDQAEAERILESLGLIVAEVEEVFRFGRDQGLVVEQDPPADTELERGSAVRLKVGRRGIGMEH
ncbi:MAG: PASTA domain-containing protein [Gemmatimonadota bacterium]